MFAEVITASVMQSCIVALMCNLYRRYVSLIEAYLPKMIIPIPLVATHFRIIDTTVLE